MPHNNLWNRLKEPKVPFELRVVAMKFYENINAMSKKIEGWL